MTKKWITMYPGLADVERRRTILSVFHRLPHTVVTLLTNGLTSGLLIVTMPQLIDDEKRYLEAPAIEILL
jgi:hypothetical protein